MTRPELDLRRLLTVAATAAAALAVITGVVGALESSLAIPDASSAYLLAVVGIAVAFGTTPAVGTAIGAFLLYDWFFTDPRYTFTVRDPGEWLNVLLLLLVGTVVGRLAGRQRARADAALAREREARALFNISFALAEHHDRPDALQTIVDILRTEARVTRAWVVIGETVAADTGAGAGPAAAIPAVHAVLRRRPGDEPAEWVRVHAGARALKTESVAEEAAYKVVIAVGSRTFGALWVTRPRRLGDPDPGETRVLAAAADQIGGSLERDRLLRDATSAEISRRSEALKSALLDSVSHDLRTPLASVRAAAGTLMDPDVEWPPERRREIAASIDREAEWLNRLVTNLLDMSRIEAGELKPSLEVFELPDLIDSALARSAQDGTRARITLDVPRDLPPVLADEVFVGQVLANTVDNAFKYGGPDVPIRISARSLGDGHIRATIEDGGAGVPSETIPRLFEKFFRVPRKGEGSRRGTGIGLSVVRGLVEAMGGQVRARPSSLGGLAVDIDLREAKAPST
jgi:two-component system, OmpR family, sensor histidine kinase KdpD